MRLYPFQKEGVAKVWEFEGRSILGDDVGLGKTIQALKFYMEAKDVPCIVLCPANLKLQWAKEAYRFFKIASHVIESKQTYKLPKYPMYIINYDILEPWIPKLKKLKTKLLIIDEGHYIARLGSARCMQTIKLSYGIPHVLILTGTPIVNQHFDLFPLIHIIDPERWDSAWSFGMEFCEAPGERGDKKFTGSVRSKKLHKILTESCLIRRTKEEVLKDLPALTRSVLPFEISNRKEYQFAEMDFLRWLASYDIAKADRAARAARLVKFGYLKRLAIDCKMKAVFQWIDDFLQESDGKLILGALHRKSWPHTIQRIDERYKDIAVSLHGGVARNKRQVMVDRFQNSKKTRIITLQLKSGGVGLNLQGRKRTMALVELPWHEGDVTQFIGRGHRIGTLDPVQMWFLIAANTVESRVCEIITKKSKIRNQAIDGGKSSVMNLMDELTIAMQKQFKDSISGGRK